MQTCQLMQVISAFVILAIIQAASLVLHALVLVQRVLRPLIVRRAKTQGIGVLIALITFVFVKTDTI